MFAERHMLFFHACRHNIIQHRCDETSLMGPYTLLCHVVVELLRYACRNQEAAAATQHNLSQLQQRCDELAAENRVLMEGSRSMRQECNEAWVRRRPNACSTCSS